MNSKILPNFPILLHIFFFTIQLLLVFSDQSTNVILSNMDGEFYPTCNNTFSCGDTITNIGYPFRGINDPPNCGHPSLVIACDPQLNITTINIINMRYQVSEIFEINDTMRLVREDVIDDTCPANMVNTTLDYSVFEYTEACTNITFFYGCSPSMNPRGSSRATCQDDRDNNVYVLPGNRGPGSECNVSVIVPVVLSHEGGGSEDSRESEQSLLLRGFDVQWKLNSQICSDCIQSGGSCGYDYEINQTTCICPDPPHYSNRTCPGSMASSPGGLKTGLSARKKYLVIGSAFVILAIVIITIIIICYLKRRPWNSKIEYSMESNKVIENFLLEHGTLAPKRYKYSQIKKITNSFKEKLGKGGYGTVYKGTLPDGRLVAVKVLTETNSTNGEEFINEVASISKTSHVHIVSLFGFCFHNDKRALVYEFMPNKSLDKYISKSNPHGNLDLGKLYSIALGVARGLEYLHKGCNTRIVHFDIKPQNILLDEDFCPKISDFGLARLCKKKQSILSSMLGARGTIGYIAPEVFSRNFGGVSHKSDVYSYGMMILEMAGERKIAESGVAQSSENYFPENIYKKVVLDKGNKLDKSMNEVEEEIARKMFLVGLWCIQTTSSDRPSMSKVVEMLEGSLQSIPIPPQPFLFTNNELSGNGLNEENVILSSLLFDEILS